MAPIEERKETERCRDIDIDQRRDKIMQDLRSAFPDIDFRIQSSPSYLTTHCATTQQSIFCFQKSANMPCETPKKREQCSTVSEFELTGSPLKLDMGYDKLEDTFLMDLSTCWSQNENFQEPLSVEDARNIINHYNSKIFSMQADERLPLWVVCNGLDRNKTLLLAALTYKGHFDRGCLNYLETMNVSDLSVEKFKEKHIKICGDYNESALTCLIEGYYRISGKKSKIHDNMNPPSKHHNGMTQLECKWKTHTLQVPAHEAEVDLVQEIVIGHEISACSIMWRSLCAIQGISRAVISLSSISNSVSISNLTIRPFNSSWKNINLDELENRLKELLNEVEIYGGLACGPKGGCICISEDTTSLRQVFHILNTTGSSNDFTFKLWEILKDSDTVEDLIALLVFALKNIYKRNLRPFIDPGNTTFLGSLVKKLARGSSQKAVKSLSTLYNNPSKALNVIGQLGIAKTSWEYTNIFALVDSTLAFNDRLKLQNKISEANEEAINQTILEMTLGSGDVTVNPFDTKFNLTDSTFVQEADTSNRFEELADLTLDNFASLKKHNIEVKSDRIPERDQPLFNDDVDIELSLKEWKFKTTRLAQLHVCMEHLNRSQLSLNLDFNSLKPVAGQLLEFYTAEKSPIKTVDQLHSEPVQCFSMPIKYKTVKEHLEFKHATLYKIQFATENFDNTKTGETSEPLQTIVSTFVCSQQQLFPPSIFAPTDGELPEDNNSLYYYCTKYTLLSNKVFI